MSLTRRNLLASAAAPLVLAQKKSSAPPSRPNIVFVLADDLAAWMTGPYGNTAIQTPNLDKIARSGTLFLQHNVCTPICSASRATIFTGRTPGQHGIYDFLTPTPDRNPTQGQVAPPASFAQEVMISDLLAGAGYKCGYVGKWHMGNDEKPGHGFSYTYTMKGGSRSYTNPEMYFNGEKLDEQGYLTELMTNRATAFLDQQTPGSPFFLTVGYLNPHTPYEGQPQKYYDLYKDARFEDFGIMPAAANALRERDMLKDPVGNIRKCAASVTALDDQLGILQRKLVQKGHFENTLFIFTSDNGYLLARHGLWSKGWASNPINMYEESVKVPMVWVWPGKVPVQSARPETVSFYDLMPTLCEATGVTPPAGRNLCGRSYLKVVTNQPLGKGVRWNDLVFGQFRNTYMARDNRYKLVWRNEGEGPNQLFDISKDPRELLNQYDNPQYLTVKEGLTKALTDWKDKYAPQTPPPGSDA